MSIDKKNVTKGANEAVEGFEEYQIPDWTELEAYDDEEGFVSPETTSEEAQGKIDKFAEEKDIDSNVA